MKLIKRHTKVKKVERKTFSTMDLNVCRSRQIGIKIYEDCNL